MAKPAAGKTVFFTGFPGFLGRRLVGTMLEKQPGSRFFFLVQEKFLAAAQNAVEGFRETVPDALDRVEYLVGDLTLDGFGLDDATLRKVRQQVNEVWHLAAVYDLSIDEKVAWNINVEGTRRVLDLCESLNHLDQFVYFSTCYVSGLRTGLILEDELDFGQGFKNNYEATKFEAESLVRRRFDRVPTIIIRPSVVIGDSVTGETDKYDGPYFLMRFLADAERQGYLKPFRKLRLPSLGHGRAFFNLVPIDYLAKAVLHIVQNPAAIGKAFAVCDPDPLTAREFYDEVYTRFGMGKTLGVIPGPVVMAVTKMPVLGNFMYIPEEAVPYAEHDAIYDCRNTQEFLRGSDIACPYLRDYLDTLVAYVRGHLDKKGKYAKY
jgi:thioester reductase-like protein